MDSMVQDANAQNDVVSIETATNIAGEPAKDEEVQGLVSLLRTTWRKDLLDFFIRIKDDLDLVEERVFECRYIQVFYRQQR